MNKSVNHKKNKFQLPSFLPNWMKIIIRISLRLAFIFTIIFIIVAIFYGYLANQYDITKVAQVNSTNIILSHNGTELASLSKTNPTLTPHSEFPPHLVNALLAREDTKFHKHIGIDVKGLARATIKNIATMSYHEGASTISMQLTKNTFNNKSKSIHRKLLEIAITLRLESTYSKDEILTHYLNKIYFGSGCYGIEQAANNYFNIPTSKLTLGQSALLVGIIRGPHIFSPFNNLEKATEQRDQVLNRMAIIKMITPEQRDLAIKAPLNLAKKTTQYSNSSYAASSVRRHQQQIIDTSKITAGGLKIASTINKKLNSSITKEIKNITSNINQNTETPLQIALVILENKTGAIRSIIGGADYNKYPYNRALDSKQLLGKAFTPFLYLATLDRGKIPLTDQPVITGQQIGASELLGYCKRFGITHKPSKKPHDLFRGDIYATPLQLANAYSIIQNNGTRAESYFVENISSTSNNNLFTHQHYQKDTASTGAALNCLKMLTKSSNSQRIIQRTAFAYKHAWIIISSKTHTAVLWIGHDLPKNIPNKQTLTKTLETKMLTWIKSLN